MLAIQTMAIPALAGERTRWREPAGTLNARKYSGRAVNQPITVAPLDSVANAVDAAESSHGTDSGMWRPDPPGPQGPMQITEAAADVGGGDRFDLTENRAIGRASLAHLYGRYRNWPDAIAAYNWGIGRMNGWVREGRPADKLLAGVALYLQRVLRESGLYNGAETEKMRQSAQGVSQEASAVVPDRLISEACSPSEPLGRGASFAVEQTTFSRRLDRALQLALRRAVQGP